MSTSEIFFAIELAVPLAGTNAGLAGYFRSLVHHHGEGPSRADKAKFYTAVAGSLYTQLPNALRGIWDYSDDVNEAKRMYADYTSVLSTRRGARTTPSRVASGGVGFRAPELPGQPVLTATIALSVVEGTPAAQMIAQACGVPKNDLWTRRTFASLLQLIPRIPFSAVRSDVFYVIPGSPDWALTEPDLLTPEFSYLRLIENR